MNGNESLTISHNRSQPWSPDNPVNVVVPPCTDEKKAGILVYEADTTATVEPLRVQFQKGRRAAD